MEKTVKSFRKVPQKHRERNKKETTVKLSHVVWGWLIGSSQ